MTIFSSIVYGIIQGLTEFLPVSSSGHLALLPKFLSITDPGVIFDLFMHLGTAFSILLYFRKKVREIIFEVFQMFIRKKQISLQASLQTSPKRNYVQNMMIATFSTFAVALFLKAPAESFGRTELMIALNLFLFGALMLVADSMKTSQTNHLVMNQKQTKISFLIGFFQALAIFPGVSRSGSTLTISRFMGLSRQEASEFSFLLSLPLIMAGIILKVPDYLAKPQFEILPCLVGMLVSFIVGLLTIHFFLKLIKGLGLWVFSVYRMILAVVLMGLGQGLFIN